MTPPLLWHFPISHYNEKVRWALDYKRIAHRREVLGPGYLLRAYRATGRGTLPILWLDGQAIGDSTRIIAALEQRYPQDALYPRDAAARGRALELEDFFDEQLGSAARSVVIGPMFRHDPEQALAALTTGMPERARRTVRPILPLFAAFYRFRHRIKAANLDAERAQVAAALDRIERELQPSGYLVGDCFGIADLTAAALLSPLVRPPEFPYPPASALPPYLESYVQSLAGRAAFAWVLEMYRRHRGVSAEIARADAAAAA